MVRPTLCTLEKVQKVVKEHQYAEFIWPDEFQSNTGWKTFAGEDLIDVQPLLMDATSANVLLTVYNALSPPNQEKFKRMIEKNRGTFAHVMEISYGALK